MKRMLQRANLLTGDLSKLSGDVSGLSGDVSGLRGDVSGLRGYVSGLRGDVDDCGLTDDERAQGVDVRDLIAPMTGEGGKGE